MSTSRGLREITTPRTEYDRKKTQRSRLATSIILTLDSNQISKIKRDFMWGVGRGPVEDKKPRSAISITGFIKIMMSTIRPGDFRAKKEEMISSLMELFDQMDLDGNGTLDFKEFLATIVQVGLSGADEGVLNPIKHYVEGPSVKSQKNPTQQVLKYIPSQKKVMMREGQSGVIKFLNVEDFGKVKKEIRLQKSGLLGCEYIDMGGDAKDVIVTCTTQHLTFWGGISSGRTTKLEEILTRQPQTCIKWVANANTMFTGTAAGEVHWWNILQDVNDSSTKMCRSKVLHTFEGHEDVVTSIQMIPSMDILLTASLDTTVRLWDLAKKKEKFRFCGHRAGVVDLAYSEHYRFLLSAGIDHDVCVWSPFADRLVFKLKGHGSPLLGVEFVPGTPQIVTADTEGWIKIWDARNFACVQTFLSTSKICGFTTSGKENKRILVSNVWSMYAFDQEGGPYCKIEGEDKETMSVFNPKLLSFLTGGVEVVRVWNALTGELVKAFRGLARADITDFCLDVRGRKFILGTLDGHIEVYNYQNGQHMKSLQPHKGEILHLAYGGATTLVSIASDKLIKVHDEGPVETAPVLLVIPMHEDNKRIEVVSCDVSFTLRLAAVSFNNGEVKVWDIDTGKREHEYKEKVAQDRYAVKFLGRLPLMAASDDEGEVKIYIMRPWCQSRESSMQLLNTHSKYGDDEDEGPNNGEDMVPVITSIAFSDTTNLMFTAEEKGTVKAWDLSGIINKLKLVPIEIERDTTCNPLHQLTEFCNSTTKSLSMVNHGMLPLKPVWVVNMEMQIRKIDAHEDPDHILVTPLDESNVTLIDFEGKLLGKLRKQAQIIKRKPEEVKWNLRPDVERLIVMARERLKRVESCIKREEASVGIDSAFYQVQPDTKAKKFQELKDNLLARKAGFCYIPLCANMCSTCQEAFFM